MYLCLNFKLEGNLFRCLVFFRVRFKSSLTAYLPYMILCYLTNLCFGFLLNDAINKYICIKIIVTGKFIDICKEYTT